MKKIIYLLIGLCSVLGLQAQNFGSPAMRKLQLAEFAISNLYVDTVNENKLVESAIIEMLAQLDPHSTYSDAEEVKKMNEPLQGNFEGIGVQFQMIEDTLLIVQPVSNGPSEKVGILAGDRIIAVNDTAIAGVKMSTEEIMGRLRGPKDSKVNLTIIRRGVKEPLLFNVKRDKIPILSLDAAYMIQPKTGYIRINRFGATTAEEFLKALKELQKKGMKDLILDLQGNGGGYLNAAIDLANEFLGQKELIVYTEGRSAQRSEFFAKGNGSFRNGRLVVLVDEYSASASDCRIHLNDVKGKGLEEESCIFITEGDSASGSITKSRDVNTQAVFSLRGKPLNSFGLTKKVVYENEEFNLLQAALNIEDGIEGLRYNKVIVATDADVDGMHIRLLLITFFLQFFPDLIKKGHVYILQTPLFRVRNKKKTLYCYTEEERVNAIKELSPNPEITRFKGLGEISPDEFKHFIGKDMRLEQVSLRKTDTVKELLEFYMGKNTMERQNFIIDNLVIEEDIA